MMEKWKKLFGGIAMTWPRLLLFAAITGVYTGLINQVPFLYDTSFRDIAVTYEWWVFFAIIVVTNCQSPLEAALKCFVFFLVSQPLVFLVEAPTIGLDRAWFYYRAYWLTMTLLTLPGGFVAYYAKKQNLLGAVVLGVGNAIVALMGLGYAIQAIRQFPCHLLTVLFCAAEVVVTTLCIQGAKRERIVAFVVALLLAAAIAGYLAIDQRPIWG